MTGLPLLDEIERRLVAGLNTALAARKQRRLTKLSQSATRGWQSRRAKQRAVMGGDR